MLMVARDAPTALRRLLLGAPASKPKRGWRKLESGKYQGALQGYCGQKNTWSPSTKQPIIRIGQEPVKRAQQQEAESMSNRMDAEFVKEQVLAIWVTLGFLALIAFLGWLAAGEP